MKVLQTSVRYFAYIVASATLILAVLHLTPPSTPNVQAAGTLVNHGNIAPEIAAHAITLNYQARLVDPSTGQPKSDGSYQISFRLYDVKTGGSPLWSETKDISVTGGLLHTLLGEMTPLNPAHFDGRELWLALKVGADEEATPRGRVAHVAYAIFAENSDMVDGKDAADFASKTHSHGGADIVDDSIEAADIKDGAIGTAELANGAVNSSKLAAGVIPRFIDLPVYAAFIDGAANLQDGFTIAGIHLPDGASTSAFAFNFTLPPNYEVGTKLTLKVLWRTPATSCGLSLLPNFLAVTRPGVVNIHGGGSVSRGLSGVGGGILATPRTANQTSLKEYTIESPDPAVKLAPGDTVSLGLYRRPSDASDTCASDLIILGASVVY